MAEHDEPAPEGNATGALDAAARSPPTERGDGGRSPPQGKRGRDSVGLYAVQCCECRKWRTVPTKDEFEAIRENFTKDPWFCSKRADFSCEDPADIEYDNSRIWVIDMPDIPRPPPKTERLAIIRRDLTSMDICYVLPNGKLAKGAADVQKFLDKNPEYKDSLSVESFNFTLPRVVEETVSDGSLHGGLIKRLRSRAVIMLEATKCNYAAITKLFMCLLE